MQIAARAPAGAPGCARPRATAAPHPGRCVARGAMTDVSWPELAAVVSTGIAAFSAVVGASLAEEKKAKLEKELEIERRTRTEMTEVAAIVARYRGPLLESCVDLEQRLWHIATRSGEWTPGAGADALCFEEVSYTLFTIAQLLGFMEVCRREGPRERNFLDEASCGSDALFSLLEGIKFVMCASTTTLQGWACEGDGRDHPGARDRRLVVLQAEADCCNGDLNGPRHHWEVHLPLRISRGLQRAIGALMIMTPVGAKRHYTLSYSEFVARLKTDAAFAAWFGPLEESLSDLLTGPCWAGEAPFPCHRWTRILLLQQLLVEAFDLLDPKCLRLFPSRRMRLAPVAYKPLPNLEAYQVRLARITGAASGTPYEALANLRDPLSVAQRGGAVAATGGDGDGGGDTERSPVPWLPWPPGAARPGGSPGSSQAPTPAASYDSAAGADGAAAAAVRAANTAAVAAAAKVGPRSLIAPYSQAQVLPPSYIREQMTQPHLQAGAAQGRGAGAFLHDVIGAPMLRRLQEGEGEAQQAQQGQQGQQEQQGQEPAPPAHGEPQPHEAQRQRRWRDQPEGDDAGAAAAAAGAAAARNGNRTPV